MAGRFHIAAIVAHGFLLSPRLSPWPRFETHAAVTQKSVYNFGCLVSADYDVDQEWERASEGSSGSRLGGRARSFPLSPTLMTHGSEF